MPPEARLGRLRAIARGVREVCHQLLGIPSYEGYVAHLRRCHPERTPMPRAAFFRDRQMARYGNNRPGGGSCC